jgi:hypothetical protein
VFRTDPRAFCGRQGGSLQAATLPSSTSTIRTPMSGDVSLRARFPSPRRANLRAVGVQAMCEPIAQTVMARAIPALPQPNLDGLGF